MLHVSSLPGPHGVGDLGSGARTFADFLHRAHQRWWQFLPINPAGEGNSPYSGSSAFAGDPTYISLEDLVESGLLRSDELPAAMGAERSSYGPAREVRTRALNIAFERFVPGREYERFIRDSLGWLPDFALYQALRAQHGARWADWPLALRTREPEALAAARAEHATAIARTMFEQFVFAQQWARLRLYCGERGIGLIGDIPIFVAHDSADVWANQELFTVGEDGELVCVSGVPPDFFSKTGQRWGTPLYRWKRMKRAGYAWWIDRIALLLERFDAVRLDHFIGFSRYWRVDASESTAEHGRWMRGPRDDLFHALRARFGDLPFIAEDLGEVTADVRRLRDAFDLPGMRIFQFSFGTDLQ
ncbi:MAG TPA: 4-alpha-glucanotransferase, partial [Kofleriaceae bacterium]